MLFSCQIPEIVICRGRKIFVFKEEFFGVLPKYSFRLELFKNGKSSRFEVVQVRCFVLSAFEAQHIHRMN